MHIQSLAIMRGGRTLFEGLNATFFPGQKVGIVGANGCGKSSLLKTMLGQLDPLKGEIVWPKGIRIATIEQEHPDLTPQALDYVVSGDAALHRVQTALQEAEAQEDYESVVDLYAEYETLGGYSAQSRAAKILHGLGFSADDMVRPLHDFSGGWRMRLHLARCLMAPSDAMILDEPTNHLDLPSLAYVQNTLKNYPGYLFVVSHDRDFLDDIADNILHIEQGRPQVYSGNYTTFERLRAEAITFQNAAFAQQQAMVSHAEKFIQRFRAKASKAKQVQSRMKALQKLERYVPFVEDKPYDLSFFEGVTQPNPMARIYRAQIGYHADHPVLKRVTLDIAPGERIGLVGPNGHGKSTLLKSLCHKIPLLNGESFLANALKIGYVDQYLIDDMDMKLSPMELMRALDPQGHAATFRAYLGRFGFDLEEALKPMGQFSGGEKVRVALAGIIWQRPNLLILDEPTNHLDMHMRQSLAMALQTFEGALVCVSHDRSLLKSTVDVLYEVRDQAVTRLDVDVDTYMSHFKSL